MADQYSALVPEITAATFSVNPAEINAAIVLSVSVTEKTVTLDPELIYSSEIYSGEV